MLVIAGQSCLPIKAKSYFFFQETIGLTKNMNLREFKKMVDGSIKLKIFSTCILKVQILHNNIMFMVHIEYFQDGYPCQGLLEILKQKTQNTGVNKE